MAIEIERKFLVRLDRWQPGSSRGVRVRQGYLSTDPERVVRVRVAGDSGFLTIKGKAAGPARLEFEYAIPRDDAEMMLDRLAVSSIVEKVRYLERVGDETWEIDVFEGENAGLVIAELELSSEAAVFDLPPWVDREVTGDSRYANSSLSRRPFTTW